jgi:hypothetical protein
LDLRNIVKEHSSLQILEYNINKLVRDKDILEPRDIAVIEFRRVFVPFSKLFSLVYM